MPLGETVSPRDGVWPGSGSWGQRTRATGIPNPESPTDRPSHRRAAEGGSASGRGSRLRSKTPCRAGGDARFPDRGAPATARARARDRMSQLPAPEKKNRNAPESQRLPEASRAARRSCSSRLLPPAIGRPGHLTRPGTASTSRTLAARQAALLHADKINWHSTQSPLPVLFPGLIFLELRIFFSFSSSVSSAQEETEALDPPPNCWVLGISPLGSARHPPSYLL